MTDTSSPAEMRKMPSCSVSVSELRAHLAEIIGRAERGEEIVISRGPKPVAKLVPLGNKRRRRLGTLRHVMNDRDVSALMEAIEKPLSPRDQTALAGGETDPLGISRR